MSRYIDADALDDTVQRLNEQGWHITNIDYKRMDSVLFEMPTADVVEVKHGEWKHTVTGYPYCSNCDWMPEEDEMLHTNYFCPNCGADMRGKEDVF